MPHNPQNPFPQFGVLEKSIFQNALTVIAIISKTEKDIYKFRVPNIRNSQIIIFHMTLLHLLLRSLLHGVKNDFKTARFRDNRVIKHYV